MLAEKANLTSNHLGMLERGAKTTTLGTFINIVNALGVSADMLLCDVVEIGYTVKNSILDGKISKLSQKDRAEIYEVIDVMIKHSIQVKP